MAPAPCLVVEDSEPGLVAGRAAGMRVAARRACGGLPIADRGELATLLAGQT